MTIARLGLKIKVKGQRSMSTISVWLWTSIEVVFLVCWNMFQCFITRSVCLTTIQLVSSVCCSGVCLCVFSSSLRVVARSHYSLADLCQIKKVLYLQQASMRRLHAGKPVDNCYFGGDEAEALWEIQSTTVASCSEGDSGIGCRFSVTSYFMKRIRTRWLFPFWTFILLLVVIKFV